VAAAAGVAGIATLAVRHDGLGRPIYLVLTLVFPLLWVAILAMSRTYEHRFLATGSSEEYRRVFDAGLRTLAAAAIIALAFQYDLARGYVLVVLPLALAGSLLVRRASGTVVKRMRRQGRMRHRAIVTGTEQSVVELIRQFRRDADQSYEVLGACVDGASTSHIEGIPVVGSSADVRAALLRHRADTVAVGAWSAAGPSGLRQLGWDLEGTGTHLLVSPSLTDVAGPRISVRPVAGLPLLHVEEPAFRGVRRVAKAVFDRTFAFLLLLLLALPMLLIGLVVRVTSPGPAMFRQTRVGIGGRTFTVFKFRSMRESAEAELAALVQQNEQSDGLLFKIRDDPRVTSVGRFLRRFSLDELPQLLNALRGEMSLVGPRPPLPCEVAQYGPQLRRRLLVKPGLTGLWQVQGRSDLSWEESVRLDLHYVENWTPALDAQILLRTAYAVLARRGAY
jgi:exopolysaccharide biosynthesis polyprenyl glycosylphosphotransferase